MRLPGPLCLSCFRILEQCRIPETELPGVTASGRDVMATSYYRGASPLRAVHRAAKYDEDTLSANWLAGYMARRIPLARLGRVDACTPIPSHPARLQDRGVDLARYLADKVARIGSWSVESDLLVRKRLGIPQNELGREERLSNVIQVFGPGKKAVEPMNVLLVDDVVTTGATLDACASILESYGHHVQLAALAFRRELFARPE